MISTCVYYIMDENGIFIRSTFPEKIFPMKKKNITRYFSLQKIIRKKKIGYIFLIATQHTKSYLF